MWKHEWNTHLFIPPGGTVHHLPSTAQHGGGGAYRNVLEVTLAHLGCGITWN